MEPENTLSPYTPLPHTLPSFSLKKKAILEANRETKIRDEGYSLGQMEEVTDDRRKANDLTPTCFVFFKDSDHQTRKMIYKGFKFEIGEEMVNEHLIALNKIKATDTSKSHLRVRNELRTIEPLLSVCELMERDHF